MDHQDPTPNAARPLTDDQKLIVTLFAEMVGLKTQLRHLQKVLADQGIDAKPKGEILQEAMKKELERLTKRGGPFATLSEIGLSYFQQSHQEEI